jgi:hypothetical protein
MAYSPRNSSGLFSGLVLVIFGGMLLLHNYRGFELGTLFTRWWPLIIIALGLIKLYERTAGGRYVEPGAARITGGEIFLVVAVLGIVGIVVGVEQAEKHFPGWAPEIGNSYGFDLDVAPKEVPADARISIRGTHGDITVRPGEKNEINVSGKANVHAWSEADAAKAAKPVSAQIVTNGDGYDVQPTGFHDDSRIGVDMDVTVPPKANVTVRNEHGDVNISDMEEAVNVSSSHGDVEVRDSASDVTIDARGGDTRVSDTKGNVKIEGHGGEVNVENASGGLTLNGEFYGPIRAEKIAKGVRFISQRTDLTLTQLSGHMEFSSGNLEIADAPGNLSLRTNKYDIDIENAGGKVEVQNRDAAVDVRFSSTPKDDVTISNSNGSISLSLPESVSFEIVADCHSCDVSSEFDGGTLAQSSNSGDAHLQGKYGTRRGPKIILKTSYGSISLHKTSSADDSEKPERPEGPEKPERPERHEHPSVVPKVPKPPAPVVSSPTSDS